jgi:hypothetical protein
MTHASPAPGKDDGEETRELTPSGIRLWLDDCRPAPPGWTLAETPDQAISILRSARVTHVSLDFHLADGRKGDEVAEWIKDAAYRGRLPRLAWACHTADREAARRMARILEAADLFWDDAECR